MQLNDMIKEMPTMGKDMAEMMKTMTSLVSILNEMLPAMKEMGPEIPRVAKRAIEALDEAVIVMKTMQHSFVFSGAAKEVRAEEAENRKKEEDKKRKPASGDSLEQK
jgi:hypothetical protein